MGPEGGGGETEGRAFALLLIPYSGCTLGYLGREIVELAQGQPELFLGLFCLLGLLVVPEESKQTINFIWCVIQCLRPAVMHFPPQSVFSFQGAGRSLQPPPPHPAAGCFHTC